MIEPIMKKVRGDGIKIQLAVWDGPGDPVICVHGITANCRSWDTIATSIKSKHSVYAMDIRGRGGSDKPESGYGLNFHVEDIKCVMEDLGFPRCSIIGHSLGAFITLAFAAKYPHLVDKIVLVDGGGDLSQEQMNRVFNAIKPAFDRLEKVFSSQEEYLNTMKQSPYFQWSDAYETYFHHEMEKTDEGVKCNIHLAHIQEEAANLRSAKRSTFFPKIQCEVLILRAPEGLLEQDDLLLPDDVLAQMLKEIPHSQAFEVKGTNHYEIIFQAHEARDKAIMDFL